MRHVAVDFAGFAEGGGCLLTVTQAAYGDTAAEQKERESHRQGWTHFLKELAALGAIENPEP